ncbi:MAG: hypothetical protein ACI4W6_00505 [Acutalibacteraceae bacterium]
MFRPEKKTEEYISKYGRTLTLIKGEEKETFKAFLQPLRYKNKMYLSSVSTDLGYDSTGKYLLICPAEPDISEADGYKCVITDGEKKYIVDRCEKIYLSQTPVYCWAVVTAV